MADTTIVFYGIKLAVREDELEALESKLHPLQAVAKQAGLDSYWGNFAAPDERWFLLIGKLLGKLGVEDRQSLQIDPDEFSRIAHAVSAELRHAGVSQPTSLHLAFQPDP